MNIRMKRMLYVDRSDDLIGAAYSQPCNWYHFTVPVVLFA